MSNVVTLTESQVHARQTRARLWNPPNARQSSEKDIVTGSELKKRRAEIARQLEEAKQAERDFRRHKLLEDLIRAQIAEHVEAKRIANKILEDEPPLHTVSIAKMLKTVAAHYRVTVVDICSHRRTANVVRPRQVFVYLAREHTLRSLPDIGRRVGGRDHTTILHAHRKIKHLVEDGDPDLIADINSIKLELEIR